MTIVLSHKIDPAKSDGMWNCQSHIRKDWKGESTKPAESSA
jgi:hypothetical protein